MPGIHWDPVLSWKGMQYTSDDQADVVWRGKVLLIPVSGISWEFVAFGYSKNATIAVSKRRGFLIN